MLQLFLQGRICSCRADPLLSWPPAPKTFLIFMAQGCPTVGTQYLCCIYSDFLFFFPRLVPILPPDVLTEIQSLLPGLAGARVKDGHGTNGDSSCKGVSPPSDPAAGGEDVVRGFHLGRASPWLRTKRM